MSDTKAPKSESQHEQSLARKLSLSIGLLNAFIIALAASACLLYVSNQIKTQLSDRMERSLVFLNEALKAPLWSMDTAGVSAVARGMILDSGVCLLEIRDAAGRVWIAHETESPRFAIREETIRHDGQIIGSVRFGLDDSQRSRAVWAIGAFGFGTVAVIVLVQFLLMSSLMHSLFQKPFGAIAALAGALVRGESEAVAQEAVRFTEFKPVVRTLLDMSQTIQVQLLELRENAQKFRAIFNYSPVGIFRASFSGRVVEANPAFASMFGYADLEELSGVSESWVDVHYVDPSDRGLLLAALEASPEGASLEIEMRRKDGSVFLAAIIASLEMDMDMRPAFLNGIIEDITERTRTQRALAESEARYRDLFDTMPNGFYRSRPDGFFEDANPAFVRMLGYENLEELKTVHIPTSLYVSETEREEILDDNPQFVSQVESYRLRRKDGTIIRIEDNARYIKDESGKTIFHEGICKDVTDRWEALAQLRNSEEKFARLFRLSPDCIMLTRLGDGLILDVNETFTLLTGYDRSQAVGKTVLELDLYGGLGTRKKLLELLHVTGKVENLEFSLRQKDKSLRQCVVSCQILVIEGHECVMAVLKDVTEFKRMQEMMIQTEKMSSLGGIAAGVAHEINNPLGIIMSTAQNLATRIRPDFPKNLKVAQEIGLNMELLDRYMQARGLHEFIRTIQDATMRAADIIRHMLDFSRRSESKRTVCYLPALIDKAIHLARSDYDLRKEYDFRQIEIVKDYDNGLPQMRCTETEIEQVILNLLRNAAQAMAGVMPPIAGPKITLRLKNVGSHLRLEVEDNGPGMSPETMRRAFEPFFTTKPPGVGTGLGLSVSYFIVTKSHNGRMRLESSPGQGTTFVVELPLKEYEAAIQESTYSG